MTIKNKWRPAVSRPRRGFTLVELVVILGIFGILMVAGTDFLIQAVRNANRSAMQTEVRQNANQIMQDIEAEARKGDPSVGFGFVGGAGNLQITTVTVNVSPTRAVSYAVSANGVLTKTVTVGGVAGAPVVLNSNSVAVLNCPVTSSGCPSTCTTAGLVVSQATLSDPLIINLTVQNNTTYTRSDFCAKVNLSDSITARQY